jgi:acetoin utilization protein AcuC
VSLAPGVHALWPTPIGVYRLPGADTLNPVLARMLGALRLAQAHARGESVDAPFFASDDDLLVVHDPELIEAVRRSSADPGRTDPARGLGTDAETTPAALCPPWSREWA